jgi:hypothetical protein
LTPDSDQEHLHTLAAWSSGIVPAWELKGREIESRQGIGKKEGQNLKSHASVNSTYIIRALTVNDRASSVCMYMNTGVF